MFVDILLKSFGGPKTSPRTRSIVQIIFSFWSFEISEGILRNHNFFIGLDGFSNNCFYIFGPIWIIIVFILTTLLKLSKLQLFSLGPCCQICRVTEEA